jgi:hypothetical protein
MDAWRKAYSEHKNNARQRSIQFLLTFDQWSLLWSNSGKWEQRGWRRGQYVMARPGDQGAYELGNVVIQLAEANRAERNRNYPMQGAKNPAFGKDYWAAASDDKKKERAAKISRVHKDRPKSEQTRQRMAVTATGRRKVHRLGASTWAHPGDNDYPGVY